MVKKFGYLCDSGADLDEKEAKELNIEVIRMPITIEGKAYIEGIDITNEDIIRNLKEGKMAKTSQPILGDIVKKWDELLEKYEGIFYIPLGKPYSNTCQTALNLSQEEPYKGHVYVVDSTFISYPIVKYLLWAREQIENGYDPEKVKEKIDQEGRIDACVIPKDLEIIKRGGRISPTVAAMAGLLKIIPLLWLDKDGIIPLAKVRTLKKAYKKGILSVTENVDPSEYEWMIIDADNRDMSNELLPMLKEQIHSNLVEQHVFNAIILSHAGPGTIGFGRIKKLKMETL